MIKFLIIVVLLLIIIHLALPLLAISFFSLVFMKGLLLL